LKPVKRKELIEKTSSELELPSELVEDIVSHYYSTLRKEMSYGNHHSICVPNLGMFVIKRKSLPMKIKTYEQKLNVYSDEISMWGFESKMTVQSELERFKLLLSNMEEQQEKKERIRKSRINESNKNLEEQG
jgi:nucleoid DNA-binding protein